MCGSHLQSTVPRRDRLAVLDQQDRRRWGRRTSRARGPWGRGCWISPLRVRAMRLALVVDDDVDADELDGAGVLGLDVVLVDAAGGDAADVEGAHRELRARLADRLGGDDADGHAFLDQLAGGQVHAVAAAADAQRRLAGQRAADQDLVDAAAPRSCGPRRQVIISFSLTIDLVGDRVDDVDAADAAADRLRRGGRSTFSPL